MYTLEDVRKFRVWRHVATDSLYFVEADVSTCSTNGPGEGVEVVVYWSMTYQKRRHREASEFLDGRFMPVPARER